ncbi:hypothetical protein [Mitsuaria sp. GD03876]|nr:hypothetical protein [Mitsuaria sp. GD03876]MDH0863489.1 hypothetical protein [Mitsuaria sp. GD03876]
MQELTQDEIDQVHGGISPFFGYLLYCVAAYVLDKMGDFFEPDPRAE